ncbi:lipid droplet-associated protein [Gordonia sp. HY002]|uniref:lipid droplet-associated protein n=1 Tax=Gordonia zhenghanii TaxID=2911516 RepID=UPI001EF1515C|nr:lipid droplet-associated protein [Gordonia zhenghanii]MCF8570394.1 lipid droplet-associated protein [Gordonia zhenghanii]MCF8604624.1 lipid droplet-associated protein [Gordonia zhenghanii]
MNRPPYPARVVAGLLATTVEETRKLPTRVITLPMSAVSNALQAGMRLQQNIAELAIKGDDVLAPIFDKAEEEPAWATFDEDDDPTPVKAVAAATTEAVEPATVTKDTSVVKATPAAKSASAAKSAGKAESAKAETPTAEGRFALYSSSTADVAPGPTGTPATSTGPVPQIVADLGYDALTLAQLRAKVRTLALADLKVLSEYERNNRNRSPFVTMIDNRVVSEQKKADSGQ